MKVAIVEKRANDGRMRREALELIAKARELGECTVIEFSGERPSVEAVVAAVAPALREADIVLIAATPRGHELAERLARELDRTYVADATDLSSVPSPAVVSVPPGTFPLTSEPAIPEVIAVEIGG